MSEDGTLLSKRIGVLIIIMNCIVLSAFVGACIDFTNVRVMTRDTKRTVSVLHALSVTEGNSAVLTEEQVPLRTPVEHTNCRPNVNFVQTKT